MCSAKGSRLIIESQIAYFTDYSLPLSEGELKYLRREISILLVIIGLLHFNGELTKKVADMEKNITCLLSRGKGDILIKETQEYIEGGKTERHLRSNTSPSIHMTIVFLLTQK